MDKKTFICLNCNNGVSSLYRKTEGKFIKLISCVKCGEIVDYYVECERSIIITDIFMQESSAYKHILFNSSDFSSQFYIKLALCIILSDGYTRWVSTSDFINQDKSIKSHEVEFYKLCFYSLFEIILFSLLVSTLCYPFNELRCTSRFIKAIILSQSGRLVFIPAIIYKQHSSIGFQAFIFLFIFISSIQSLKAISGRGQLVTTLVVGFAFTICIGVPYLISSICNLTTIPSLSPLLFFHQL